MTNLFQISEEEKNRIRGLHITESKDKRIISVLNEAIPGPDSDRCFTVNFESGGSVIEKEEVGMHFGTILNQIYQGMLSDRPFIDIEVGVSGPGSVEDNEVVMNQRANAALDYLIGQLSRIEGPTGLEYSAEALKNKSTINKVYGTEEAGSILDTGEKVPTDPTDEYFEEDQYVKICFNLADETPGYDSLADEFMEATIRNTFGYDEETVYGILDKLRDKADFDEFSAELKRSYGMDFYGIACDTITADLTPGWMDKILGTSGEVTLATEIGPDDTTINVHLKRLGVDPISC